MTYLVWLGLFLWLEIDLKVYLMPSFECTVQAACVQAAKSAGKPSVRTGSSEASLLSYAIGTKVL